MNVSFRILENRPRNDLISVIKDFLDDRFLDLDFNVPLCPINHSIDKPEIKICSFNPIFILVSRQLLRLSYKAFTRENTRETLKELDIS